MPLYSDHITNMYFSGTPSYSAPYSYSSSVLPLGSSYSASYLNPGGSYSSHSSLGTYSSRPTPSRWVPSSARNYSPILSTISERGTSSPVRISSPRRLAISKRTFASSYTPRPITINTADIDVSKERYRPKEPSPPAVPHRQTPSPDKDNGPFMPRVDGKPETGIDSSPGPQRSTIRRGRTVVRLTTIKRKERDSPRKKEDSQADDSQSQDTGTVDLQVATNDDESTEMVGWREKLSEDLTYVDKRQKKTLGAKLVEKFIVRPRESDPERNSPKEMKSRKLEVSQSLPVSPLPTTSTSLSRSPDRRCSVEMLEEQANVLDSLIRNENLSVASLDLSKVGISDDINEDCESLQLIKRRKSNNALQTTKSDHSLHESLQNKDPKHYSKRRSLKKSSSGGSIRRLDSITEFPRESTITDLPVIEEIMPSKKRDSIKAKPKAKAKITSSVEISEPKSPLKFKIENVTVEEKLHVPKKEFTYSSVVEDISPTEIKNNTKKGNLPYNTKKKTKTLISEDVPESPEPDDGNFWDKIGKRETVYLIKRKQYIEDGIAQSRRALAWFPVDEEVNSNDNIESNTFFDATTMKTEKNNKEDITSTSTSSNQLEKDCLSKTTPSENTVSEKCNLSAQECTIELSGELDSKHTAINKVNNETKTSNILENNKLSENKYTITQGVIDEVCKRIMADDRNTNEKVPEQDNVSDQFATSVSEETDTTSFSRVYKPFPENKYNEIKDTEQIANAQSKNIHQSKNIQVDSTISQTNTSLPIENLDTKMVLNDKTSSQNTSMEPKEIEIITKDKDKTQTGSPKLSKNYSRTVEVKSVKVTDKSKVAPKTDNVTESDGTMSEIKRIPERKNISEIMIKSEFLEDNMTKDLDIKSTTKLESMSMADKDKTSDILIVTESGNKNNTTISNENAVKSDKSVTLPLKKEIPYTVKEKQESNKCEAVVPINNFKADVVKTIKNDILNNIQTDTANDNKTKIFDKSDIPVNKSEVSQDRDSVIDKKVAVISIEKITETGLDQTCKRCNKNVLPSTVTSVENLSEEEKNTHLDKTQQKSSLDQTSKGIMDKGKTKASSKLSKDIQEGKVRKLSHSPSPKSETSKIKGSPKISGIKKADKQMAVQNKCEKDLSLKQTGKPMVEKITKPLETKTDEPASCMVRNSIDNSKEVPSNILVTEAVAKPENIPNTIEDLKIECLNDDEISTGEDKKAETVPQIEETKEEEKSEEKGEMKIPSPTEDNKLKEKETLEIKPIPSPRRPVKAEAALRPLIATPRPLQKKMPQVIHSSSSSSSSSSEESSEEEDAGESDASEDSTEFFECENNPDGRTSTGSNDSGFDSSAPTSPAGFLHIKKDCDVNCHRKCEKLTANLCGVNQRLLVEALATRSSSKKGGDTPGTSSGSAPAQTDATEVLEQELEQSTAYGIFRKTGRFTPPARSIPRFRKYNIEDFQFIKVLGKGSFGKVLLAELRDTEYYYAVKCLKKDVVLEDDDVECTLIERKVLALGTNHPYLCHLFATFQTDSHLFFVMEYLNGGDLMFHIQQSGRFPESRARFYAAEIVSGLKFLHKRGIVYRDLKLDNILLDFDGHVRIADFGMCKLQIYLEKTADTFCGTPDYMAPEIIKGQKYNQTVDWWSFGVLLYEMLIGQSPFSGCDEDELFWSICNEMPSYPRFLSQDSLTILTRLLDKDSRSRMGGTECMHGDIREQTFFNAISWDRLERRELDAPFKPRVRHPLDTQYFDRAFTGERPRLTAVEPNVLRSMDQAPFRGFSYTNPNATDR